jgi:hypothetical protein
LFQSPGNSSSVALPNPKENSAGAGLWLKRKTELVTSTAPFESSAPPPRPFPVLPMKTERWAMMPSSAKMAPPNDEVSLLEKIESFTITVPRDRTAPPAPFCESASCSVRPLSVTIAIVVDSRIFSWQSVVISVLSGLESEIFDPPMMVNALVSV